MSHDILLNPNTGQQSDKTMPLTLIQLYPNIISMHLLTLLENVPD